ncbi:leishmanolysin-like peptidase 2, partial [Stegodyphus dumicola]|uniref:leishmanolysin-like peptidase 2 n=1 Tax=Stegodyphus dumicola TaxID=202533 RepID=UPI0015AFCA6D
MCKLLAFYGNLLFIIHFYATCGSLRTCLHDDVIPEDLPASLHIMESRRQRHAHETVYVPLQISTYMENIDQSISGSALYNIEIALNKVIKYVSEVFQVSQTKNPFLLNRNNCVQRWKSGVHKNKCARIKAGPEFCSIKDTSFAIPNRFLNQLNVYDFSDPVPRSVFPAGPGIKNANFILCVSSRPTSWCEEHDVEAYGSYCRLGANNRPVAGLLNICPGYHSKKLYTSKHYFNVIMHEVFHILGFSQHLFPKYKTCTSAFCDIPMKIVQTDSYGVQRLLYPEVVKSMQSHFNCSDDEFGAPLAENSQSNSSNNSYTSHWHPVLMYTSIMTPSVLEDDYVVIDNITLALFASTGWYKINFSKAEDFNFGLDGGCDFGFRNTCESSKHLCLPSSNLTSCDVLYYTVGACESVVPYHPCGIYKPDTSKKCLDYEGKLHEVDFRATREESRCMMMQLRKEEVKPTCLIMKCKTSNVYEVLVDSKWLSCQYRDKVQISNITVYCPQDLKFCRFEEPFMKARICLPSEKFMFHACLQEVKILLYHQYDQIDPEDVITFSDYKGFRLLAVP